jgi:hypothetical protein
MIVISMIVTAIIYFLAGMHFATWDQNRDTDHAINSLWWSIGLCLIGTWNMIGLVGAASRL